MNATPALEGRRSWRRHSDLIGVGVLTALIAIVAWNRLSIDPWMARVDILTFYLPWYGFLGNRLRDLDIPGWNPHLFSGTPFVGDPQSGWMYLPAMLFFPFLSAVTAFKAMVVFQFAVAAYGAYAFARVLRMGIVASLVAASLYGFGPILQWDTYCCTVFAQAAIWLPLALLGIELALRPRRWRDRLWPWFLTGFAVSQIFSGSLGQGTMDSMVMLGTYLGYRVLFPARPAARFVDRIWSGLATGITMGGLGGALGAAGLLPRLAINSETNLAGGSYNTLGAAAGNYPPWTLDYMLAHIIGGGYHDRPAAFGGAAWILLLLALVLAGRKYAVPYFAGMTIVVLILTQPTTPIHQLFYLIPRYQSLHEHEPGRVVTVLMIGPAILAAAAVNELPKWRGRRVMLPVAVLPLIILALICARVWHVAGFIGTPVLIAAAVTTLIVALVCLVPRGAGPPSRDWLIRWAPLLLLAVVLIQPTGEEIVESMTGRPLDPRWTPYWDGDPTLPRAVAVNVARTDPGGAGEFLQDELAAGEPFRYFGYGGIAYPGSKDERVNYQTRRTVANIQAILVNARPIRLGLYAIQGYDPVQLKRYAQFITAINQEPQNYHVANIRHRGVDSPLLNLLDLRYVLLDATLPHNRQDVIDVRRGRKEVFRNKRVIVYENPNPLGHAWIVHDVRSVAHDDVLHLMEANAFDPQHIAFVEGQAPATAPAPATASETARVIHYEPDALTIATTSTAPGLLVISEVYSSGWRAKIDGKPAKILPTDYVLRGVPLPAGKHTVTLTYDPPYLRLGLVLTIVSTVAMIVVFIVAGWSALTRRRRPSENAPE
jgi:hypothetical protein